VQQDLVDFEEDRAPARATSFLHGWSPHFAPPAPPPPLSELDLLGFERELREAREIFQDRRTASNVIVSTAVGLVDEFAHRSWDEIVDKAYAFYIDQSTSSTEKARRPERS